MTSRYTFGAGDWISQLKAFV